MLRYSYYITTDTINCCVSLDQKINAGEQGTPTQDMTVNTSNSVKGQQLVLLQTAQVEATNESNNKTENVRILLDNGSEQSYITDSLRAKLGPSPIKKEKLILNNLEIVNSKHKGVM